jgi:hypothetical protein
LANGPLANPGAENKQRQMGGWPMTPEALIAKWMNNKLNEEQFCMIRSCKKKARS